MMPAVEVSNQPLGKVLENIRKQVPSFHFAVFRSPSVSPDYPTLPVMSLEGVTIDQFLDLIKFQYPDIKIVEISGEKQPLYSIRIDDTSNQPRTSNSLPVVKVFRLNEITANAKSDAEVKKSTDDILSLIQAAMDAAGGDPKDQPTFKFHQATQTLIFKGSPEKLAVLNQVLESLKPKVDERIRELHAQIEELKQTNDRLNISLEQLRSEYAHQKDVIHETEFQLLTTKTQLGQAQGQLSVLSADQMQKQERQKLADAQRQDLIEKIRSLKAKMQGEQPKNPEFAKDQLELDQLIHAAASLDQQSPATQPSK